MSTIINIATGAVFGAALVAAGVHQPAVINSQLQLKTWHLLQVFLTATASSALIATTAQSLNLAKLPPRSLTSYGWFAPYDGNIVGGLLLGAGMALSGACPGMIPVQVAVGVKSGAYTLAGAVLGGIAWSGFLAPRLTAAREVRQKGKQDTEKPGSPPAITVMQGLGSSKALVFVAFEAVSALAVIGTIKFGSSSPYASRISPVVGGLLVGLAQLVSVLARGSLLGVSTVYEEAAQCCFWAVGARKSGWPKLSVAPLAAGMVAGAVVIARAYPFLVEGVGKVAVPSPAMAVLGGFASAMGARMAGGCMSGHGISGSSLFSISSWITVAAAFIGGGVTANLVSL